MRRDQDEDLSFLSDCAVVTGEEHAEDGDLREERHTGSGP
jgi:hypothetical protein